MERVDVGHLEQQLDQQVRERFAGAPIHRVAILQYGDEPEIEPGELLARVYIDATGDKEEQGQALERFHDAHRAAIRALRRDLDKLPSAGPIEFVVAGGSDECPGPKIKLGGPRGTLETDGVPLIPVMARLGPADLETVDTLITAGIAANRAEAVRWALARIRERSAFAELQQKAREIEELKGQF
jgi:hypothetical protein